MSWKFLNVLKERTGVESITKEQVKGIKELVRKAHEWDEKKAREHMNLVLKMPEEEYSKLWKIDLYSISDCDKEKLKNLDQKTVFNNIMWLSRNVEKIDSSMRKFLGMHVWVVNYWIKTVGSSTVRKFLRENNYSGEFVYFLYKYFNL
ncbi:uncharacterized protein Eint_081440 [Encephalitozoon intestinalis ATCC 50506]|uniref:Uncharacterized protein n=1 Tax=Encephalitozoon intestinalis (strain ATCC 50506) TaxID=876142 RepID=E0S8D9_ENCIT|nr:uncharacterized protein Eint_081440 [Encephalitozoon intestinalis ATCC 50506]ADM12076.1 hypothetical protein Eint_081440 [Encephalitozoon intestinalis ATCC 50506]UTX45868.1 hypothetical protein GPK93_08g14470 [Encephalitozoon intestinalis]